MGTHPIFESDFDCLTEIQTMSLSRAYRGFRPLANRVLVRLDEAVTVSKGGIMLPVDSQSKLNIGTVIAHGKGYVDENAKLQPLIVTVDQRVMLPEFGGTEVLVGDEKLYLYRDLDFLGTIE